MKTKATRIIFILLAFVFVWGCASHDGSSTTPKQTPQEALTVSPPEEYNVYSSGNVQFATVTLILPLPLMGETLHGKWRSQLAPPDHRPKSEYVSGSDKLNVSGWHDLICSRARTVPSYIEIDLNPDIPDDKFELSMPISAEVVTGRWAYVTDAGGADYGAFVGPVHKMDNWLEPQLPLVFIDGEFLNPGLYLWTNGITAADVIREAGGLTVFAAPTLYIDHLDGSRQQFQLKSGYQDTNILQIIPNIVLKPEDKVQCPR